MRYEGGPMRSEEHTSELQSRQSNSAPSALNYYTFKFRHLLLSLTPTQRLSNKAPNLMLGYVLYFPYFDGCRVFDLVRDLERR